MVIYEKDSFGKYVPVGEISPCNMYVPDGHAYVTKYGSPGYCGHTEFFESFGDALDYLDANFSGYSLTVRMVDGNTGLDITYSRRMRRFVPAPSNHMITEHEIRMYGVDVDDWCREFGGIA